MLLELPYEWYEFSIPNHKVPGSVCKYNTGSFQAYISSRETQKAGRSAFLWTIQVLFEACVYFTFHAMKVRTVNF